MGERCLDATRRYYAAWTSTDPALLDTPGVHAVRSAERDVVQTGYSSRMDLYCLIVGASTVVSYGTKLAHRIGELKAAVLNACDAEDARERLQATLGGCGHGLKFVMTRVPGTIDTSRARQLCASDYDSYARFFCDMHANEEDDWLREYFVGMVRDGLCWGVFVDGRLVCATDAPSVPYFAEEIVEQGINTLEPYRGRGYATAAAGAMARHVLAEGKVPIWSCGAGNVASVAVAEGIGYARFADVLSVTLD